jgi:hypothetical protein
MAMCDFFLCIFELKFVKLIQKQGVLLAPSTEKNESNRYDSRTL